MPVSTAHAACLFWSRFSAVTHAQILQLCWEIVHIWSLTRSISTGQVNFHWQVWQKLCVECRMRLFIDLSSGRLLNGHWWWHDDGLVWHQDLLCQHEWCCPPLPLWWQCACSSRWLFLATATCLLELWNQFGAQDCGLGLCFPEAGLAALFLFCFLNVFPEPVLFSLVPLCPQVPDPCIVWVYDVCLFGRMKRSNLPCLHLRSSMNFITRSVHELI